MIYIVVEVMDTQAFVEEVNEWIGKGFTPIGGVATIDVEEVSVLYTQAMISESSIEENKPGVDINKILVMGYEMSRMGITMDIKYEYLGNRYRFESENTDQDYTDPHKRNMAFKMLCYEDAMSRGL